EVESSRSNSRAQICRRAGSCARAGPGLGWPGGTFSPPAPGQGCAGETRRGSLWPQPSVSSPEMLIRVQQLSLDAPRVKKQGLKKPEASLMAQALKNQSGPHSAKGKAHLGASRSLALRASWALAAMGRSHIDQRSRAQLALLLVMSQRMLCPSALGWLLTDPAPGAWQARVLRGHLRVEKQNGKFRPFHLQFKSFPEISFLGPKAASPFEAPMTPSSSHHTREAKDREPSRRSAACTVPRRRKGYCECCQEAFEELHRHLQSPQHQDFALEAHLYAEVDRIIAQLSHSLADVPFQASLPGQPGSLTSDCDPLCPEPPPPLWPSPLKAASPWRRKDDHHQAPEPGCLSPPHSASQRGDQLLPMVLDHPAS
ncbi:hypothetical protein FD754_006938, partial [Muntiacus muntjak]